MSLSTTTAPPAPSAPAGSPQPPKRRATLRLGRFDLKVSPYLYVAPFFIVFGVFGAYPMFKTLYMSFTDWDLLNERTEGHTFVGFKNYAKMFGDEYYWNALTNTIGVFLLATIPQILLALLLANWLNRPLRARSFFRMAVLIPNATSVAAVAIIFGTRVALSVNGLRDKELAGVLCRAVNRWLLEEYLPIDPKRLKGVGLIPCQDPLAAVKELEWLIQHRQDGVVSAMLPVNVYGVNLGDRRFDPEPRHELVDGERPRQRVRGEVDDDADGERGHRAAERAPQREDVHRQLAQERQGEGEGPRHRFIIAERAC